MSRPNNQRGFTIIELLLAMTFFAFILVFMTTGFIFINRQYTKGVVVREVHNNARIMIEDLARNLRHNRIDTALYAKCDEGTATCASLLPPEIERMLCLENGQTYYWQEPDADEAAAGVNARLWTGQGCLSGWSDREPLLPDQVSVWDINVTPVPGADETYRLMVAMVATGERLTVDTDTGLPRCAVVSGPASAYCDVVDLTSVITSRQ